MTLPFPSTLSTCILFHPVSYNNHYSRKPRWEPEYRLWQYDKGRHVSRRARSSHCWEGPLIHPGTILSLWVPMQRKPVPGGMASSEPVRSQLFFGSLDPLCPACRGRCSWQERSSTCHWQGAWPSAPCNHEWCVMHDRDLFRTDGCLSSHTGCHCHWAPALQDQGTLKLYVSTDIHRHSQDSWEMKPLARIILLSRESFLHWPLLSFSLLPSSIALWDWSFLRVCILSCHLSLQRSAQPYPGSQWVSLMWPDARCQMKKESWELLYYIWINSIGW
jgi:hypothetical protein